MNDKKEFPTRKELDQVFHLLQDKITKITVEEEEEMIRNELNGKNEENRVKMEKEQI